MKQSCIADSTTKAEYMDASEAAKEVVWLRKFLQDLEVHLLNYFVIIVEQWLSLKNQKPQEAKTYRKEIPSHKRNSVRGDVEVTDGIRAAPRVLLSNVGQTSARTLSPSRRCM